MFNLIKFKRGKDKKKRKSRNLIGSSIGGTIGLGTGLISVDSEGKIWGKHEYKNHIKYLKNQKNKFPDPRSIESINRDLDYIKQNKNKFIKDESQDYYNYIKKGKYYNNLITPKTSTRIINKVNKIRNKQMLTKGSIGLGLGAIGGHYLYNKLRNKK